MHFVCESKYEEGEMLSREISFFKRNPKLVEEAKKLRGCDCEACGFNFKEKYGFNGEGYIEAHHNTPLSAGEGEPVLNSIADISLLCANCHRMAHRNKKCLTISELKAIIEPPQ